MRNIAIIGSGQAGLLAAHGLINAGYRVTLYSDRTADQWLNESRPTGTAARFHISLEYERELGLNYWERDAPVEQDLEQVLGRELLMPLAQRERLGGLDEALGAVGVFVEIHDLFPRPVPNARGAVGTSSLG